MVKTILSHFYNEEYLLPHWLDHHRKLFDHGIMINYGSTDRSVDIIKKYCPGWSIINSRNNFFDAFAVDSEIYDIEKEIEGFRICLNTTEFIIGNFKGLKAVTESQIIIPVHLMVDMPSTEFTDIKYSLIKERRFGIPHSKNPIRRCRSMHNFNLNYLNTAGPGRHFSTPNTQNFIILYYGFCPMNEQNIKRKIQMKGKMPPGVAFAFGNDPVTDSLLIKMNKNYQLQAEDLSEEIERFTL